jgi:hypothetical protein
LNKPLRILIPAFFNVPQHENLRVHRQRATSPPRITNNSNIQNNHGDGTGVYLTNIDPLPIEEVTTGLPSATVRKIKDLKMISLAMRRQKNLK